MERKLKAISELLKIAIPTQNFVYGSYLTWYIYFYLLLLRACTKHTLLMSTAEIVSTV